MKQVIPSSLIYSYCGSKSGPACRHISTEYTQPHTEPNPHAVNLRSWELTKRQFSFMSQTNHCWSPLINQHNMSFGSKLIHSIMNMNKRDHEEEEDSGRSIRLKPNEEAKIDHDDDESKLNEEESPIWISHKKTSSTSLLPFRSTTPRYATTPPRLRTTPPCTTSLSNSRKPSSLTPGKAPCPLFSTKSRS